MQHMSEEETLNLTHTESVFQEMAVVYLLAASNVSMHSHPKPAQVTLNELECPLKVRSQGKFSWASDHHNSATDPWPDATTHCCSNSWIKEP